MGRLGITYEEVVEAALSLEQKAETPTIDKIRAYLGGTGSNTTISKYLQRWRQQFSSSATFQAPVTPDIVKTAVDRVWHEMREQTDREIESIKTEAQRLIDAAESRAHRAEAHADELQSELDQLQQAYTAQSTEKELLQLDMKNLRGEHVLLQERFKNMEERYAEIQALTSQHLQDLANAHKNEVLRLEEACRLQTEGHAKLISTLKDQNEKERQDYMVSLDQLKVENKKSTDSTQKLQAQLLEKNSSLTQLHADLKMIIKERDDIASQLEEHHKKWSFFNDKTLVSSDILTKIYDAPKLDSLLDKFNVCFTDSLDKKFFEITKTFKFEEYSAFLKEKCKVEYDE